MIRKENKNKRGKGEKETSTMLEEDKKHFVSINM